MDSQGFLNPYPDRHLYRYNNYHYPYPYRYHYPYPSPDPFPLGNGGRECRLCRQSSSTRSERTVSPEMTYYILHCFPPLRAHKHVGSLEIQHPFHFDWPAQGTIGQRFLRIPRGSDGFPRIPRSHNGFPNVLNFRLDPICRY